MLIVMCLECVQANASEEMTDVSAVKAADMADSSGVEPMSVVDAASNGNDNGVKAALQQIRKHADDVPSESPPKKKKKKSLGEDGSKNALQTLNEMIPGLQYNCISQTGPVHQPTFTVQVTVNGQVCCFMLSFLNHIGAV